VSSKLIMSADVLVTYASRAGSTAEIADAIHQVLVDNGLTVHLRPMHAVDDITPYQAVVAGSAIRMDKWLPEAMQFVERHQSELQQKPFAAFVVCLALATRDERRRERRERALATASGYLKPVRALVSPVSEGLFAGVLDLSRLPLVYRVPFSMLTLTGIFKEGDYRDWEAIRHWADGLPVQLVKPSLDRQHV
jgi:menaquinone-dependent protoporphyrinogen oxidase